MSSWRKTKSRTVAPAVVYFGSAKNERGQRQLAVWAECTYGGRRVGPVWSHTDQAVTRVLATLTHYCDCGRRYHKARYYEGCRITNTPPRRPTP